MSQDPRVRERAVIDDVKDEVGTKGLEARFHVAVPADVLLEILWEPTYFDRLYPEVKSYEVLVREEAMVEVRYRISVVVKEMRYVLRRDIDRDALTIEWRELSGDLRRVRGGWWLSTTDANGVCYATYRAFIDVGRFVPTGLVVRQAKKKIDEMVERVRRVAVDIHAERVRDGS